MKVGVLLGCSNTGDWDRVLAKDWSRPPSPPDHEIVEGSLKLGDLVEPLGFDRLWMGEHFGTPYVMTPNVLQHLAYWAGRTEEIELGTAVVVLPWWHPVRLAHQLSTLDIMLKGRRFAFGVGRGIAESEYAALGVSREESRDRYQETIEILRLALTQQRFSYDGKFFKIPEMSVRPQPRHADLMDNISAAFTTPESMEIAADQGFSQLFVTGASPEEMGKSVARFNGIRARKGLEPDQATVMLYMYCGTEREVEASQKYHLEVKTRDAPLHYTGGDPNAFQGVKGYERYDTIFRKRQEASTQVLGASTGGDIQAIGTPDQIIEGLQRVQELTSAKEFLVIVRHGTMPLDEVEKSMRLFAKEVLPVIQAMPAPIHPASLGDPDAVDAPA